LSNVIKSNKYVPLEDIRKVEALIYHPPASIGEEPVEAIERKSQLLADSEAIAAQLLEDAKTAAEAQIQSASVEAARVLSEASAQIEKWWDERRLEDLRVVEESRQSGFEAGYREGFQEAEMEVAGRYDAMLQEARALVEESHRVKERVIAESEPFLVDLATAIARKIVGEHLAVDAEWTVEHVKRTLERRREKGLITLCVAPSQFAKLQDARSELTLAVDSQAELQIVPDATVDEGGCMVRSSFGSIDARIDTQLSELKKVLMEVAARAGEGVDGS
jgi:flagellar assembly protein FliH